MPNKDDKSKAWYQSTGFIIGIVSFVVLGILILLLALYFRNQFIQNFEKLVIHHPEIMKSNNIMEAAKHHGITMNSSDLDYYLDEITTGNVCKYNDMLKTSHVLRDYCTRRGL